MYDDAALIDADDLIATARALIRGARMLERVDTGLTMPQYRLLSLLAAGDERSTALAQRLAVSKPAISNAVETLAELGHLRRRGDSGDRRVTWLQLTAAGQAALAEADRRYSERLQQVAARMADAPGLAVALADFASALDRDLAERRGRHDLAQGRGVGADALAPAGTPA